MSLHRRIALLAAAAVAAALLLAGAVTYVVVRANLRGGVDDALRAAAPKVVVLEDRGVVLPAPPLEEPVAVQLQAPSGDVVAATPGVRLPGGDAGLEDRVVDGVRVRVLRTRGPDGGTLVLARSLAPVDDALARLRWILGAVGVGGVLLAAGLGLVVARGTLAPLGRLSDAAERVATTGDLQQRLAAGGDDELARLTATFNRMLAALQRARDAQRRLVADASHELRTPLTSVRANVELLERAPDLPAEERAQVLRGVRGQVEELTVVVGDLIDLARDGTASPDEAEELRLDDVVAGAVERARRLQPGLDWRLEAAPSVVVGERARIHRAVMNLLDNAAKWSPPAGVVEVRVDADGTVVVRDHGPGIPEDELPLVFDRFHRAREARGLPGSGLGLAIVRQVAEAHGGAAVARNVRDGGAELVVRFSGTS